MPCARAAQCALVLLRTSVQAKHSVSAHACARSPWRNAKSFLGKEPAHGATPYLPLGKESAHSPWRNARSLPWAR
eukprot:11432212-Alexandrium_andersonii.AAC.1